MEDRKAATPGCLAPSFHYSIIPSFHRSNAPSFRALFFGPVVEGRAFADVGDAGLAGDGQETLEQIGSCIAGDAVVSDLHIPHGQTSDLDAEANFVVVGQLLRFV